MPFTVGDYTDLLRLLADHPEWRSDLRHLLLSDELLTLPQLVRDLSEAQDRTEDRVIALTEAQQRTSDHLGEVERHLAALAAAQARTAEQLSDLARAHLDLVEIARRHEGRLGSLWGDFIERKYRRYALSYFGRVLRRPRVVPFEDLEDDLRSHLLLEEFADFTELDLLVRGFPLDPPELTEVYLAIEVSSVMDRDDVERAERRASLLRRLGRRVVPMVAGERMTEGAKDLVNRDNVAVVEDGSVSFWKEALRTWAPQQ